MKKILSMMLVIAMIIAIIPCSVIAEGTVIDITFPTYADTDNRNSLVVTPEITVVSGETPASYKYQWYAKNNKDPYDEYALPWETNASIKIHSQIPAGWWLWLEATPLDSEGNAIGEPVKKGRISTYPMKGKTHSFGEFPGHTTAEQAKEMKNTPSEYLFEVDGVKFILLDKLYNGQYYVMMENAVGEKKAFDTRGAGKSFDPNASENIGYWLNNDFLSGSYLPNSVKENIVEGVWTTEGANASYANSSGTYKVGLLSYSEYNQYYGRFGLLLSSYDATNMKSWEGFWLRTLYNNTKAYASTKNGGTDNGTGILGALNYYDANKTVAYARPTFRLSEDFFEKVKIDLSKAGAKVKDAIAACKLEELESIYTRDELINSGIIKKPVVKDISVSGNFAAEDTVKCDYVWFSENNLEDNSRYGFSVSDTPDGEYTDVLSDSKEYKISENDIGKYLTFYVIPCDSNGVDGELSRTKPVLISEKATVVVTSCSISGKTINMTLKNLTEDENKVVTVMATTYDSENKITGCYAAKVNLPAGETVSPENLSLGSSQASLVKVMVWDSLESMKSIYLSDI